MSKNMAQKSGGVFPETAIKALHWLMLSRSIESSLCRLRLFEAIRLGFLTNYTDAIKLDPLDSASCIRYTSLLS
jgi:hypothetical protein